MDREMEAMERQMMSDFDNIFARSTRSVERARERLQLQNEGQGQTGASIERRVEGGGGSRSFSYYQSIEIYNGPSSGPIYNRFGSLRSTGTRCTISTHSRIPLLL